MFLQGLVNLLTKKRQPQTKHRSNPSTHFPALHPGAMVPSKGGKVDKVDGQNASLPPKVKPWLGEAEAEAKATREYLRFEICDFHCKGLSKTVPLRHRDELLGFFNVFFPSFKTWGGGWENRTMEGVCVCVRVFSKHKISSLNVGDDTLQPKACRSKKTKECVDWLEIRSWFVWNTHIGISDVYYQRNCCRSYHDVDLAIHGVASWLSYKPDAPCIGI